ncbi:MAG: hypothetical protein AAFN18_20105 [Cyanobacteria bacterium J06554_6]
MVSAHRSHSRPPAPSASIKPLLAAGLLCALAGLAFDFQGLRHLIPQPASPPAVAQSDSCTAVVQANSQITREQLAQVLAIPERDTKSRVRQIIDEPYCQYTSLKVRSGVDAEREAYPLAFDPDTKLVILYENDEYAGYRFNFE